MKRSEWCNVVKFFHRCLSAPHLPSFTNCSSSYLPACNPEKGISSPFETNNFKISAFKKKKIGGAAANGRHEGKLITFAWWRKQIGNIVGFTCSVNQRMRWPQQNITVIWSTANCAPVVIELTHIKNVHEHEVWYFCNLVFNKDRKPQTGIMALKRCQGEIKLGTGTRHYAIFTLTGKVKTDLPNKKNLFCHVFFLLFPNVPLTILHKMEQTVI